MVWLAGVVLMWLTHAVHSIQNTTSVVVARDGWTIYPCHQLNHRLLEFDSSEYGLWYVIEVIEHTNNPNRRGIHLSDNCPKINLIKTPPDLVKLNWQEKDGDIHYIFKMTDPENEGFWLAWDKQTGKLVEKGDHHFHGSVQVVEADPSRMVLTFCSNQRTHYSVIMVRNISVTHNTESSRRRLTDLGLPQLRITQTCNNAQGSAASLAAPFAFLLASSSLMLY